MSHCVPDWDATKGGTTSSISLSSSLLLSKPIWELQCRKPNTSLDLAHVPDPDLSLQTSPPHEESISLSAQHGKSARHVVANSNFSPNSLCQNDNSSWSSSTRSTDLSRDGSLSSLVNSVVAEDPTCSIGTKDTLEFSIASIDEDMLAYLYPLDNPLDKSYPVETLGYLPTSQLTFYKGSAEFDTSADQLNPHSQNSDPAFLRKVDNDVAFDRRHGEVFELQSERAHSVLPESLTSKCSQGFQSIVGSYSSFTAPSSSASVCSASHSIVTSLPTLPPRWPSIHSSATGSPSSADGSLMNFSYFSRPAALAKASLQTINVCSPEIIGLGHQPSELVHVEDSTTIEGPTAESTAKGHVIASNGTAVPSQGASFQQAVCDSKNQEATLNQSNTASCAFNLPSSQGSAILKPDSVQQGGPPKDDKDKNLEPGKQSNSIEKACEVHVGKNSQSAVDVLEAVEPTSTTSLGCSGITAERCKKEDLTKAKKRGRVMDDPTEGQSENAEDDLVELKKPIKGSSSKRSRAAEVHNLSERRRRDRINEKMKALQELIPNSNKTDKASMLDEAIEYLKMLQLQLQMMSVRTGLSIPRVLVSPGMQNLQMSQIPTMSMGMAAGLGMGIALNMAEMGNGGPGRPLMLFPPVPGSSDTAAPPTMSDIYERLPSPAVLDPSDRFVSNQQVQVPGQQVTMDLYHAYILQQQQQQIHQQVYDHLQASHKAVSVPPR